MINIKLNSDMAKSLNFVATTKRLNTSLEPGIKSFSLYPCLDSFECELNKYAWLYQITITYETGMVNRIPKASQKKYHATQQHYYATLEKMHRHSKPAEEVTISTSTNRSNISVALTGRTKETPGNSWFVNGYYLLCRVTVPYNHSVYHIINSVERGAIASSKAFSSSVSNDEATRFNATYHGK